MNMTVRIVCIFAAIIQKGGNYYEWKKTEDSIVLAFEKKLVVSDGYMYGTNWDHRDKEAEPVKLVEKRFAAQFPIA